MLASRRMGGRKLKHFGITLRNPHGVYSGGQALEGHVTLELNETMKMKGVRLLLRGRAYVHWREHHPIGTRKKVIHHRGREQYLNVEVLVFGPGTGTTDLPEGEHTLPFTFQLPPKLPSSFESHVGHVRYCLQATIERPWKFDHVTKKLFTVLGTMDLNQNPNASRPLQGENEKSICFLCCKTGPVSAVFRLDHIGYVPGDPVNINVEINNQSNRKLASAKISLIMITNYHAKKKTKTVTKEVTSKTHGEIGGHSTESWSGETMIIPPLPPSYMVGCKIIDIRYILQLEVDPAGPAFDLEIPLEIIIGTVPLRTAVHQYAPPSAPYQQADAADAADKTAPVPLPHTGPPDLPQPIYIESILGKVHVTEEEEGEDNDPSRRDRDFAPVYAFYDWSNK